MCLVDTIYAPEGNARLAFLAIEGWCLHFAKMLKPKRIMMLFPIKRMSNKKEKKSILSTSKQIECRTYFPSHLHSQPSNGGSEKEGG